MSPRQRRHRARALAATLAAAVFAGGGCAQVPPGPVTDGPVTGGTLRVSVVTWPAHLDPQRIGATTEANLGKLVTRTLTTFRAEPQGAGSELVPDLATDLGRPAQGNTVWDFTLREGSRWEDGEPVTCQDLKYGVERRYSRDEARQTGSTVPFRYLRDNDEAYRGPWVGGNNDGAGLVSVECLDQRVIRYHLVKPVGDFNLTVSLPVFAPVRPGADDDRDGYDARPLATGPYRIGEHRRDPDDPDTNRLVLERNPHWQPATDPHRPAFPDRIVVEPAGEVAVLTDRLIRDQGEDRARLLLDADLAPAFRQQVMTDPALADRVAAGPTGAVQYLAVNTELIPDPRCRQALAYGIDKQAVRAALGGQLRGELATTLIPPNLPGHPDVDPFGTREVPAGQPEQATTLIAEAAADDVTCPEEISFAYPDNQEFGRLAGAVVESYRRIGVRVATVPVPPGDYFTADGVLGERAWELTWMTLVPAWPNGSAVIPGLFDGRVSAPGSASYLIRLDDDRVHGLIDAAFAEAGPQRQHRLWAELDAELTGQALVIPLLYPDALRLHGSHVSAAPPHPQLAMPDLAAIGLTALDVAEPTQAP